MTKTKTPTFPEFKRVAGNDGTETLESELSYVSRVQNIIRLRPWVYGKALSGNDGWSYNPGKSIQVGPIGEYMNGRISVEQLEAELTAL